jgi:hypothetical protein
LHNWRTLKAVEAAKLIAGGTFENVYYPLDESVPFLSPCITQAYPPPVVNQILTRCTQTFNRLLKNAS